MSVSRAPALTSLWLVFFVNGAVLAGWAPRIPEVKERIGLSDADLGVALLGIALGAVPAMLVTARVLRRFDDRRVCAAAVLLFPAALPLIDRASSLVTLLVVLVLLGAVSGALDVTMNAVAVRLQALWRVRVLGRLHGAYSLGVLAGTAGATVATHLGATTGVHFVTAGVVLVVAGGAAALVLCTSVPRVAPSAPARGPSGGWSLGGLLRDRRLVAGTAVIAIGGFLLEGLVTDWSALLLRRDLAADPTLAASVLVLFSVAMFVSRSLSDTILHRVDENVVLTVAAVLIATAVPVGILSGSVPVVVVGVVVTGLCVGPLFPLALARGARTSPGDLAGMTARLSVVGYAAYLAGPPLIGFGADRTSLPSTVTVVIITTATVLGATALVASRTHRSVPRTTTRDGVDAHDHHP